MKKIIVSLLSFILLTGATACSNTSNDIAATETTSASETLFVSEPTAVTTTETAHETETEITETEATLTTETVSEPVYEYEFELDKSQNIDDNFHGAWITDPDTYINKPMYLNSFSGTDVYLIYKGEEVTDSYTIILDHNGTVDEIPYYWFTRYGEVFDLYEGDYDSDGETELASVRYSAGGTFCAIYELAIYKKIDGHYQMFLMDHDAMLNEYIEYSTDNTDHTITVRVKDSDIAYTMDTTHLFGDDTPDLSWGMVVFHSVNGIELSTRASLFLSVGGGVPCPDLYINMKVHFADGKFTFSDPFFEYEGTLPSSDEQTPEDVIAMIYAEENQETIEHYQNTIEASFRLGDTLYVIPQSIMSLEIINGDNLEIAHISRNAEAIDIKIVERDGKYYLVSRCKKGTAEAFRTMGSVISLDTMDVTESFEHIFDNDCCTDSTPDANLPTSETFESYNILPAINEATEILRNLY